MARTPTDKDLGAILKGDIGNRSLPTYMSSVMVHSLQCVIMIILPTSKNYQKYCAILDDSSPCQRNTTDIPLLAPLNIPGSHWGPLSIPACMVEVLTWFPSPTSMYGDGWGPHLHTSMYGGGLRVPLISQHVGSPTCIPACMVEV